MKDNYCPVLWGDCWNKISIAGEWDEKRLPEVSGSWCLIGAGFQLGKIKKKKTSGDEWYIYW